ncbi:MAG TPA: Smr/MutS family protein [Bacillota bacterium]|nr:Smr/MutS family protein [Bacillota bacterium]HOA15118.1 Smr/MutS family protein [Bacillota bacterium]HOG53072.1 Smr/MutS family protein [Bacillota bacterium]
MKLDLHGMRTRDAVERFISEYNRAVREGADRLEVVHGYGSTGVGGDIKAALAALLDAYPGKVRYIKGESLGNKGMTIVLPDGPLPPRRTAVDEIAMQAMSKAASIQAIEEKLCGLATSEEVMASLKWLVGSGRAVRVEQNGRCLYTRK